MRLIVKNPEPVSLTEWKRKNPRKHYSDLDPNNADDEKVRTDIKNECLSEQYHLCAYCCNVITLSKSHNEHIIPQSANISLSLDYNNIVASCNEKNHCGHHKANSQISLTPLMQQCETEVRYNLNGKVWHKSQRGQQFISKINLGDRGLTNKRRDLVNILIMTKIGEDLALLDKELLDLFANDLLIPDKDKLEAFAPVLSSILRNMP